MTIPSTSQDLRNKVLSQEDTPLQSVETRAESPLKSWTLNAAVTAKNALGNTMTALQQKAAASGPTTENYFNQNVETPEVDPEDLDAPDTVRPRRHGKEVAEPAPVHKDNNKTMDYVPTPEESMTDDGVLTLAPTFPGFSTDPELLSEFNEDMISFGTPQELYQKLRAHPNLVFYGVKFLMDEYCSLVERFDASAGIAKVNNQALTKLESTHQVTKAQLKKMTRQWETADDLGKAMASEILDLKQGAALHLEVEAAMKKDLDLAEEKLGRRDATIKRYQTALQEARESERGRTITATPTPSYNPRFQKSPVRGDSGGAPPPDGRGVTPGSAVPTSQLSYHGIPKAVCRDPFKFGGKEKDKPKFEEWLYALKNKLRVDKAYLDHFYPGETIVDFIVSCTEDIAWRRMQQHLKGNEGVTHPFLTVDQAITYLKAQYGPQNSYRVHAHEFERLEMGNMNFEDFYAKFEEHALPQNLPEKALIESFRTKLHPRYLAKIVHEEYDTLQDAVAACRKFKIGFEKMDDIRNKSRSTSKANTTSTASSGRKSFYRNRPKPADASEIEGVEEDDPGVFPEWAKKLPRLTPDLRRENRRKGLCDACRKPNHIATSPDCELYRYSSRLNEVQIDEGEPSLDDDDEEFDDFYGQGNA